MTKVINLHDYMSNQELTQASCDIVEYLDNFSERCKTLTKELKGDIEFIKRHKAGLVDKQ